jgi:hypothetical protein
MRYDHVCPICGLRWGHENCAYNQPDPCPICSGRPMGDDPWEYEDELSAFVVKTRAKAGL